MDKWLHPHFIWDVVNHPYSHYFKYTTFQYEGTKSVKLVFPIIEHDDEDQAPWMFVFAVTLDHALSEWPWVRQHINTVRPTQNGRHFADDTFKLLFLNENIGISIKISLKFLPKGPINNIPALVQVMAWRRPGDKPLTEPMVVGLLTHICVTRPQWVITWRHRQIAFVQMTLSIEVSWKKSSTFWFKSKYIRMGLIDSLSSPDP